MTDRTENPAPTGQEGLDGLRVLVVEDRGLIASKIVRILHRAGCVVAGMAGTLGAGLDLAGRGDGAIHAAVLDVDLRGEPVYPLAEALRARGVPFLFLTGYGQPAIPEAWRWVAHVEKPFDAPALLGALARLVRDGPAPPGDGTTTAECELPEVVRRTWGTIKRSRDRIMEAHIRQAATGSGAKPPGQD